MRQPGKTRALWHPEGADPLPCSPGSVPWHSLAQGVCSMEQQLRHCLGSPNGQTPKAGVSAPAVSQPRLAEQQQGAADRGQPGASRHTPRTTSPQRPPNPGRSPGASGDKPTASRRCRGERPRLCWGCCPVLPVIRVSYLKPPTFPPLHSGWALLWWAAERQEFPRHAEP